MLMRKIFILLCACCLGSVVAQAQEFSAVNADGVTLYYSVTGEGEAELIRHPEYIEGVGYEGDVVIPTSVEHEGVDYAVTGIGETAFGYCDKLTSVSMPASIERIGESAFAGCELLKAIEIPASVKSIGDYAFEETALTEIHIPAAVESIGEEVFGGCLDLKAITVDGENPRYDSRDNCNAIIETESNTLISGCAGTVIPGTVEHIGHAAFYFTGLESVVLPASVRTIGPSAFQGTPLKSVEIPDGVTEIGMAAFLDCRELTSVVLPESLTEIDTLTFQYCFLLKDIKLPSALTRICVGAFNYCFSLETIELPASLREIESLAFSYCLSLREVCCRAADVPAMGEKVEELYVFTPNYCENLSWSYDEAGDLDFNSLKHDGVYRAVLRVPQASVEAYRAATGWGIGECWPEEDDVLYYDWKFSLGIDGEVCNYFHDIQPIGGETSTESTVADGSFTVYSDGGVIYIDGAAQDVEVYDITGRRIFGGNSTAVSVGRSGAYIVRSGDEVRKVMVR